MVPLKNGWTHEWLKSDWVSEFMKERFSFTTLDKKKKKKGKGQIHVENFSM